MFLKPFQKTSVTVLTHSVEGNYTFTSDKDTLYREAVASNSKNTVAVSFVFYIQMSSMTLHIDPLLWTKKATSKTGLTSKLDSYLHLVVFLM